MAPAFAGEPPGDAAAHASPSATTSACCRNSSFRPAKAGRDYKLSPYLENCATTATTSRCSAAYRIRTWTAGIRRTTASSPPRRIPGSGGFRNTISLDQFAAERIGQSHALPVADARRERAAGPAQPLLDRRRRADPLRGKGRRKSSSSCSSRARRTKSRPQMRRLELGQSIMDAVADQAQQPGAQRRRRATATRLDQYFTGVRDLEQRLARPRSGSASPSRS